LTTWERAQALEIAHYLGQQVEERAALQGVALSRVFARLGGTTWDLRKLREAPDQLKLGEVLTILGHLGCRIRVELDAPASPGFGWWASSGGHSMHAVQNYADPEVLPPQGTPSVCGMTPVYTSEIIYHRCRRCRRTLGMTKEEDA
jgi:hypothetical protein